MRSIVLCVSVMLAVGCSSPTAPTQTPTAGPRTGTWVGSLEDASNGQGTLRVTLQETLAGGLGLLGGTWAATFADASKNANGEVSGGVTGSVVQFTLRRTTPVVCPNPGPVTAVYGSYIASDLTVVGTTISGPLYYVGCTSSASGSLLLTRQ